MSEGCQVVKLHIVSLWMAIGELNHILIWPFIMVDFWNRIVHRFANIRCFLLSLVNRLAMQMVGSLPEAGSRSDCQRIS